MGDHVLDAGGGYLFHRSQMGHIVVDAGHADYLRTVVVEVDIDSPWTKGVQT